MNAHHKYGPSSLERCWLCPASARLSEGLQDISGENACRDEGILMHEALATGDASALTPEQREAVEWALDYIASIIPEGAEVSKEKKLRLVGPGLSILTEGTPDFYAVSIADSKAWLIDYKCGYNEVEEPANNWQLAACAAMIMQRYAIDKVNAQIVYPRFKKVSQPHTFTDYDSIVHMIEAAVKNCEAENAPCVPGEKQCKYCKAGQHGKCPAQKAQFESEIVKAETAVNTISLDDLTNDEMSKFYLDFKAKIDALVKFWESVKTRIRYRIDKDGSCGVLTIGKGAVVREVKDIQEAFRLMEPYLTREEFLGCASVSASKLEKAYSKKRQDAAESEGGKILLKTCKGEFESIMGAAVETKTRRGEIEVANG